MSINGEIVDDSDYYTQPLVSKTGGPVRQSIGNGNNNPTQSSGSGPPNSSYISDPFVFEGRLVKYSSTIIENVDIPQNAEMPGYIDLYEEGRLMAFSVTCNDSNMIPVCKVQNDQGSENNINDLSFLDCVNHGRGMTYSEATSTIKVNGLVQSRDVSGQTMTAFPYVARFKDTVTGNFTNYDDYKGTVNDKFYVMKYEPTIYPPYRRLYFNVINNSVLGTRNVNRLEIKRLIYVEQQQVTDIPDLSTDFTQLDSEIEKLSNSMMRGSSRNNIPNNIASYATSNQQQSSEELFKEFLEYMKKKNGTTVAKFSNKPNYYIDQTKFRQALADRLLGGGDETIRKTKEKTSKNTMKMKFG